MDYRTLGRSGCAVSSFCLGTMTFGSEADEQGAHEQLDRFAEAGGTLVDTADVYSGGMSEEIIGRWFASRPAGITEPVVLATKGRFGLVDFPNGAGLPGLGLLPWSPLGGGWLSGKYKRGQRPSGATRLGEDPDRGMEAYDRRGTQRTWEVIDAVQKVAGERGVSMAEVALAWVTGRPVVSSTILGARTAGQLEANLRAAGLRLSAQETAALNAASDPQATDYPYGEMGTEQRGRRLAGGR